MPIRGRDLRGAAQGFCDHINRVLTRTVTETRLVLIPPTDTAIVQIGFRQAGRPIVAPLNTAFGPMGLYLGQVCGSEVLEDGQHELRTVEYKYHLYDNPAGDGEALFRWEYVRQPAGEALWCRHHLQGPIPLTIREHRLLLKDWHLPTGYVPFEEVLRFCIVDLGVRPLSAAWGEILRESYDQFKTEFTQ